MKKIFKSNVIKKITLSILIIMTCFVINPICSNAIGIGASTLTKPISGFFMRFLDSINATLATFFAYDAKINSAAQTATEIRSLINDETTTVMDKIAEGLDDLKTGYYNLLLSPDDIFSNNVQITNANIFSDEFDADGNFQFSDANIYNHLMKNLKKIAASFYYVMRNLAIVILLCLLIYSGIRIVLASSRSDEKAKWKMYLMDWLKALALVMFIHMIMIGVFYVADIVTNGIKENISTEKSIVTAIRNNFDRTSMFDTGGNTVYIILYAYVTYMTIVFLIAYFKRLFYVIVLIIVAPVVSALYALGKTGKETFNRWFTEFIMGVMVQPFHMLIYSILVLLPITLLSNGGFKLFEGTPAQINFSTIDVQVYALIAISMIRPIEKYMRQIFGFGKTALDNVASFESGKKTLDTGVKVAVKTAETIAMAAAIPFTAGGSAAALGAKGVQAAQSASKMVGAAKSVAGNGLANGISAVGEGISNVSELAGKDPMGLNPMGLNPLGMNVTGAEAEDINTSQTSILGGGSNNEILSNGVGGSNFNNAEMTNNIGEGNFNNTEMHNGIEEGNLDNTKIPNNSIETLNGINGSRSLEKNAMNSADLKIGTASSIQIGNFQGKFPENSESKNNKGIEVGIQENNQATAEKPTIEGQNLATALLGRLGLERVVNTPFLSPGMLEQYKGVRQAAHEFTDSFYIGESAPRDWKGTDEISEKYINNKKENNANRFINNPSNIENAIKVFELKDKEDEKTGKVITKEQQAKEKLANMQPYANYGVNDVATIKNLMDRSVKPEKSHQTIVRDNKELAKITRFVNNAENIKVMQNIVANKMGKSSSDPAVIQQVRQNISDGTKYITSGAARDPETLNRLVELERKIDSKINMGSSEHHSKTQYVVDADRVIEKALKDGIKNIKLPVNKKMPINDAVKRANSEAEKSTKALEKAMNEALQERRRETSKGNSQSIPASTTKQQKN